jgi:hypothetical protein
VAWNWFGWLLCFPHLADADVLLVLDLGAPKGVVEASKNILTDVQLTGGLGHTTLLQAD